MGDCIETYIEAAGFTDVGPARDENQDAIVICTRIGSGGESYVEWSGRLFEEAASFSVVDGMGGYKGGREAAQLCAKLLSKRHVPSNADEADKFLETLSNEVDAAGKAQGFPRMGAALATLTICGCEARFINVGDCRIYGISGNSMGQMTVDDRVDDDSPGIMQALGPTRKPDSHYYSQILQCGLRRFLICSDGVWGTLGNDALKQFSLMRLPLKEICSNVRERLFELNSSDNCSFVIVDVNIR